jgi:hypothetical protein
MEIILDTSDEQYLNIIPRRHENFVVLTIIDKENEDNKLVDTIETTIVNEFMTIPFEAAFFRADLQYFIEVRATNNDLLWRGLGFCTNETQLENYKIDEQ